jgi:hypothetical protein
MFESLLGPKVADPDRILRCEIMFPDGDVTTLGFATTGSEVPRSLLDVNRGELGSVGVGGVLTIIGASPEGGVVGAVFVSIVWIFAVRGRSGGGVATTAVGVGCLSGNIDPILDATLLRLPSPAAFSLYPIPSPAPPDFRSGLVFGLDPR